MACVCVRERESVKGEQKEEMNDQQLNNLDLLCRYPLLKIKKSPSAGSNESREVCVSVCEREGECMIDVTRSLSPTV